MRYINIVLLRNLNKGFDLVFLLCIRARCCKGQVYVCICVRAPKVKKSVRGLVKNLGSSRKSHKSPQDGIWGNVQGPRRKTPHE